MSDLSDSITLRATVKTVRFDESGECLLTLRIPATDAAAAARFALMRDIVFASEFTPEDVAENNDKL